MAGLIDPDYWRKAFGLDKTASPYGPNGLLDSVLAQPAQGGTPGSAGSNSTLPPYKPVGLGGSMSPMPFANPGVGVGAGDSYSGGADSGFGGSAYDPFTDDPNGGAGTFKSADGSWGYNPDSAPAWLKGIYSALPSLLTGGVAGGVMGAGRGLAGGIFNEKSHDTGNLITQFDGNGRPIGGGQGMGEGQSQAEEYMAALEAAQGRGQNFGASPGHVSFDMGGMVSQRPTPPTDQFAGLQIRDPTQGGYQVPTAGAGNEGPPRLSLNPFDLSGRDPNPWTPEEKNLISAMDQQGNANPQDEPGYWDGWWMDDQGNSGWN